MNELDILRPRASAELEDLRPLCARNPLKCRLLVIKNEGRGKLRANCLKQILLADFVVIVLACRGIGEDNKAHRLCRANHSQCREHIPRIPVFPLPKQSAATRQLRDNVRVIAINDAMWDAVSATVFKPPIRIGAFAMMNSYLRTSLHVMTQFHVQSIIR
ncbi:MAG: hypothetical protein B6D36_14055 [Planctomycetes bacterium UTPLA1]|nr:MAG: hypothetical protein B6D36_14055 [Planctomycetes bacterium UTPLA1]